MQSDFLLVFLMGRYHGLDPVCRLSDWCYNTYVLHMFQFSFNSVLHCNWDVVGWSDRRLYAGTQCHGVCDWEFSKLITEQVFELHENLCGEVCVTLHSNLMDITTHCDNSHAHTRTKS